MHADMPAACENCATKLQGAYCHVCGQHAANPLRHFGHAVEEVFESFWHLDGRVFRTLRDLVVPGRVACNYLAGHRVRYIAPLRLFVILTVLTFFVGQVAVGVGASRTADGRGGAVQIGGGEDGDLRAIREAGTVAEVEATLARQLEGLRAARENAAFVPGVRTAVEDGEKRLRAAAAERIATLRASSGAASTPAAAATPPAAAATARTQATASAPARATTAPATGSAPAGTPPAPAAGEDADAATNARRALQEMATEFGRLRDPSRPWHETGNPVDATWIPAFADGWFNHRLANFERNVERFDRGGNALLVKLLLASVPPALFVLMPVFALLLRVMHPFGERGYLEHLVVALYSHAAMLLVLLSTFAFVLLRAALPWTAVATATYVVTAALWAALPVYLFVMQRRVYRQHWLATAGKYAVLGTVYLVLVVFVAAYSLFAALTTGA